MSQSKSTEAVKQLFTNNAKSYGRLFGREISGNAYRFAKRARICRDLTENSHGSLLDLACGTGEVTRSVLEGSSFSDARICDISEKMIEVCSTTLADMKLKITFSSGNCFDITPDGKYDLVMCVGLLAHTGRLNDLAKIAWNQLKPNGTFLLQSTLSNSPGGMITRLLTDKRYEKNHKYALSHYTNREIHEETKKAGFVLINSRSYSAGFVFLDRFFPKLNFCLERLYDSARILPGSERIYLFQKPA